MKSKFITFMHHFFQENLGIYSKEQSLFQNSSWLNQKKYINAFYMVYKMSDLLGCHQFVIDCRSLEMMELATMQQNLLSPDTQQEIMELLEKDEEVKFQFNPQVFLTTILEASKLISTEHYLEIVMVREYTVFCECVCE